MKIMCPVCHEAATIRKTNRKHHQLSDLYCACSNVECGHTYVMNLTFSHTLSPSALDHDQTVKRLLDAVKPEDRNGIISMLQHANDADKILKNQQQLLPDITVIRRQSAG